MSGFQELKEGKSNAQVAKTESGTSQKAIKIITKKLEDLPKSGSKPLSQEMAKEIFEYNPITGVVCWKCSKGRRKAGKVITNKDSEGYLRVGLGRKSYKLHRIIWLLTHGYMPEYYIDHINRNKSDNRLCNLREVSHTCNLRNSSVAINNTTGVKGVRYRSEYGVYIAQIKVKSQHKHLCWTECFVEAVAHRLAAEQCLDWVDCDSNSTAYQFMQNYLKENQCI